VLSAVPRPHGGLDGRVDEEVGVADVNVPAEQRPYEPERGWVISQPDDLGAVWVMNPGARRFSP
jgi:hypothetical protein